MKLPGLIERVKNISWWGFTRVRRGAGLKAYIRNHFCVWSSSHLLFVSQKKGMENGIRQKNQCCFSKILDSKQCTWCLSQFGTISFIKPKNSWGGALISVDLLKITLLHIFFLYIYKEAKVQKSKIHYRYAYRKTDALFLVLSKFILTFVSIIWGTDFFKISGTVVFVIIIVVSDPFFLFVFLTWRCFK